MAGCLWSCGWCVCVKELDQVEAWMGTGGLGAMWVDGGVERGCGWHKGWMKCMSGGRGVAAAAQGGAHTLRLPAFVLVDPLPYPACPSPQLAYEADDFSGADLSAVVSEAQLAVVHETLEAEGAAAGKPGAPPGAAEPPPPLHKHRHAGGAPTLQQRHLRAALDAARPSVPEPERLRLEAVYRKFQQSREPGGGQAAAVDKGKGKKVSWA